MTPGTAFLFAFGVLLAAIVSVGYLLARQMARSEELRRHDQTAKVLSSK